MYRRRAMPLLALNEKAVVDSFKKDLDSITFLAHCDTDKLKAQLDELTDPNKSRYEMRRTAKVIWKLLLRESLNAVVDNTRGVDELSSYFDKFAKYENMLVALDENYRDHVIHTLWVMLLGYYVIKVSPTYNNISYDGMLFDESQGTAQQSIEHLRTQLNTYQHPLWSLIALTHDLGYPIQKSKAANDTISDIIKSYGFLRQTPMEYNFTVVHHTAIQQLLDIMSAIVIWLPGGFKVGHRAGAQLDMAKSFEALDHGIMSAYLLLKHLDFFCDTWNITELEGMNYTEPKWAAEIIVSTNLLSAISSHTSKNYYTHGSGDMSDLLFLSDELEEFSRFSFVNDDWRNVKCRTEFEFEKNSLSFKYVFEDNPLGDLKSFFKAKVAKIRRRFQLASGQVETISLTSEDVRQTPHFGFTYTYTLTQEYVREFPSGLMHNDVLAFLA
jgi:hypothetical protein